jgi:hypothetical protein
MNSAKLAVFCVISSAIVFGRFLSRQFTQHILGDFSAPLNQPKP